MFLACSLLTMAKLEYCMRSMLRNTLISSHFFYNTIHNTVYKEYFGYSLAIQLHLPPCIQLVMLSPCAALVFFMVRGVKPRKCWHQLGMSILNVYYMYSILCVLYGCMYRWGVRSEGYQCIIHTSKTLLHIFVCVWYVFSV